VNDDLSKIRLSDREARCLHAWEDVGTEYCLNFRGVSQRCTIEARNIRRVVRSLARKGLLEFQRGLFDECDGSVAGAGYSLTPLGADLLDERIEAVPARESTP
jgi:hypothetical protein